MNTREESKRRAVIITKKIKEKADVRARELLAGIQCGREKYEVCLADHAIVDEAWEYITAQGIEPKFVFAHPDILQAHPQTSLHYRGISTLSLKRVQTNVRDVKPWEEGRIKDPRRRDCEELARFYNMVISSIVLDTDEWTLENGYRNILATMGIQQDGALRNIVGAEGEKAVRMAILAWLKHSGKVPFKETAGGEYILGKNGQIRMTFSSEPDIRFERMEDGDWITVSTIEVKSGNDPAGALERLGAIKKSFENTPVNCKNFAVIGVVTPTMENLLKEMRIERYFDLLDITQARTAVMEAPTSSENFERYMRGNSGAEKFFDDIFNHALRLV